MAQVLDLDRRINAGECGERLLRAIGARDRDLDRTTRLERRQARDSNRFGAIEVERGARDAVGELQR